MSYYTPGNEWRPESVHHSDLCWFGKPKRGMDPYCSCYMVVEDVAAPVPLPFYNGFLWWLSGRYVCQCGAPFWRMHSYEMHWVTEHAWYKEG